MTKNTQILIGVGVVGVGAYLLWKSKQPKKTFANAMGRNFVKVVGECECDNGKITLGGTEYFQCKKAGYISLKSKGGCSQNAGA